MLFLWEGRKIAYRRTAALRSKLGATPFCKWHGRFAFGTDGSDSSCASASSAPAPQLSGDYPLTSYRGEGAAGRRSYRYGCRSEPVECDHTLGGTAQAGHDEAEPWIEFARTTLDLGEDAARPGPACRLIAEAGVIPGHVLGRPAGGGQVRPKCPLSAVPSCSPWVGLTELSMSSTISFGGLRS